MARCCDRGTIIKEARVTNSRYILWILANLIQLARVFNSCLFYYIPHELQTRANFYPRNVPFNHPLHPLGDTDSMVPAQGVQF